MTRANHSGLRRLLALFAVLALAATACGRDDDSSDGDDSGSDSGSSGETAAFINPDVDCDDYKPTQGVENGEILVGTVRPAQGPYAIYDTITKGLEAYFDSVNSKGGVEAGDGNTYTLTLVKEDDAYDPGQTPEAVEKLVEQEGVFALVGEVGTENNLAVRDYVNAECVPSIALATGSPEWGKADQYPWFIGGLPSYATEARVFLEYLEETNPDATIALLYQADDFGNAYKNAIETYIAEEDTSITLVADESFDPASGQSTEGVTASLAQSGADTFFVGIGGVPCPQTLRSIPGDWTPETYVSITCSGKTALSLASGADEGVLSTQAQYDPASSEHASHPKVQQFRTDAQAEGLTDQDIEGGIVSAGWGFGSIFVRALELAPAVTRADVMNTLFDMQDDDFGLVLDEVLVNTNGSDDPWLIEGMRIVKREGGEWVGLTEINEKDGESNSYAG